MFRYPCKCSGVVVSYFEWVQNIQSMAWDLEEVNQTLKKIMMKAYKDVREMSRKKGTTMRMGAYMVAIDRITTAGKMRAARSLWVNDTFENITTKKGRCCLWT